MPLYDFPNQKITNHLIRQSPLRTSALRALGGHANAYAIECFIDELAEAGLVAQYAVVRVGRQPIAVEILGLVRRLPKGDPM